MIAIFFATEVEGRLFLKKLNNSEKTIIHGFTFIKGEISGIPLLVCFSGIGKISGAVSAVLAFEKFPVKKAIISGIAGAYPSSGLTVGEIAIADREIDADKGLLISCDDKDDSFIFMNNCEGVLLYIPDFLKNKKIGTFLTVSACTGNLNRAKFLEKKFNAICENMEGAAIANVAQIYKIPVSEIRSISNIITDRKELLKINNIKKCANIVQEFILENLPLIEGSP